MSSTKFAVRAEAPYQVHPWISEALYEQSQFFPFPDRAQYFSYERGELKPLTRFEQGDVLWISFVVSYFVGPKTWGPEIRPIEIIRLGHRLKDDADAPSISRPRLKVGRVDLVMKGTFYSFYLIIINSGWFLQQM